MRTEVCYSCGIAFAMTVDFYKQRHRRGDDFYCPSGHAQHYTAEKNAQERLAAAEARTTAVRDQLEAAVRDGERTRKILIRDRMRFANGVCPCCNRSFENVRRHMQSKHPDYDVTRIEHVTTVTFKCSCGREFDTMRGLGIHQGHSRPDDWFERAQKDTYWDKRSAHTTTV